MKIQKKLKRIKVRYAKNYSYWNNISWKYSKNFSKFLTEGSFS